MWRDHHNDESTGTILNRKTGEPIFGVEERMVPQGGVAEEWLSKTQPYPVRPKTLARQELCPDHIEPTTSTRRKCRELLEGIDSVGIFTPPSLKGSILFPKSVGGLSWSGVAIDPVKRALITNSTNIARTLRLFPAANCDAERAADPEGEVRPQRNTPHGVTRSFFTESFAFFCDEVPSTPGPWGYWHTINLDDGKELWKTMLGHYFFQDGLPSLGRATVTAGRPRVHQRDDRRRARPCIRRRQGKRAFGGGTSPPPVKRRR